MLALALLVAAQPASSTTASPALEIGRLLYGGVLLVTQQEDGFASYGSGIVVDKEGDVLTNLHVVDKARSMRALTHDPEKPSYAATRPAHGHGHGHVQQSVFQRPASALEPRCLDERAPAFRGGRGAPQGAGAGDIGVPLFKERAGR